MYPKIIWQDIVSVRGEDHAMRVVQVAPDEAVVEWVASRDTMGCPMWCRFEDWYPTLVGDLMRKACLTLRETDTAMYKLGTADKINLIRLVRVATQMHEKTLTRSLAPGCMGLKDAKDLVEKWLDNPRGDL